MKKTFVALQKLRDVELELHRLKNALEMANRSLDAIERKVWVGLTPDEVAAIVREEQHYPVHLALAIEEKLREKNK